MKEIVMGQLAQRDLLHLYSDRQFQNYVNKTIRTRKGGNKLLIAYHVLDLFILNGKPRE